MGSGGPVDSRSPNGRSPVPVVEPMVIREGGKPGAKLSQTLARNANQ
jgi:hypothetical protein